MNQPTHAWLAVEAYRKIAAAAKTDEGKKKKLEGLEQLLGEHLQDVVVAAWLPDALIKDMQYGHIFKNSLYAGDQKKRFVLSKEELKKNIARDAVLPKLTFDDLPAGWWKAAYRVKEQGGHLPARVNALSQTVRDMLRMGDNDVVKITGTQPAGAEIIPDSLLFSPRDIAVNLWMMSHYIADAHMPFHCDNRALGSTSKQKTHGEVEDLWGEQVPELFHAKAILTKTKEEILAAQPAAPSKFAGINFGNKISPLKNSGDPWKEAVYLCRMSFAVSFALVPPGVADVDDQKKKVSLNDILTKEFCGEEKFWKISTAIMADAARAIAMFWQDAWTDFVKVN
jgi:hypothetical protein